MLACVCLFVFCCFCFNSVVKNDISKLKTKLSKKKNRVIRTVFEIKGMVYTNEMNTNEAEVGSEKWIGLHLRRLIVVFIII